MTAHANPLAPLLTEAQKIIIAASDVFADKRAAIKRLADLLCSPEANAALAHADAYVDKAVAEARAAFVPALESAEGKLTELRAHYDDLQLRSIDRTLVLLGTDLKRARDGQK